MAFPFDLDWNFESGANPATSSSGTLLDFPHYTELARYGMAPYRGAYCYRIRLAGGTTDQYIQEDTLFDVIDATPETWYLSWYFYLGKDLVMGSSDKLAFVTLRGTAAAVEVAAGIQVSSGELQFWWNETAAAASPGTVDLGLLSYSNPRKSALGKWYHAELKIVLDAAAGTIDGFIGEENHGTTRTGTQITTLAQTDILDGRFGTIGPDSGTSGTILFDDVKLDDAQVFPHRERFMTKNRKITAASDHPIIGRGEFAVALTGTSTDAVLRMYDTDGIPTNLDNTVGVVTRNLTANEMVPGHDMFEVQYGLYTILTGTAAEASISKCTGGPAGQGDYITKGKANVTPLPR